MTNAFEPTGAETTQPEGNAESFVSKLVAERGDVWSDPEVIAKGKLEADRHIAELEDQLKQYREDQSKQDYAKQVLEELQKGPQSTPATATPTSTPGETNEGNTSTLGVSEEDLKGLVEATLAEREKTSILEKNLSEVNAKLAELHGDKAAEVVSAKAVELGMSVERMQRLAEESPAAFMSLIGVAETKPKPITSGSVNTNALPNPTGAGVRDAAYYREMRKNDKSRYYSPAVQRQMMADAQALGDKFRT